MPPDRLKTALLSASNTRLKGGNLLITTCARCSTSFRHRASQHPLFCGWQCYTGYKRAISVEERFWQKVRKTEGCWLWIGATDDKGYGQISLAGHAVRASRVSWQIHYGPIPSGKHVLHHCDNQPCIRPDHLFLGTNHDNVLDKIAKGRHPRGQATTNAILNPDLVHRIRELRSKGLGGRRIGQLLKLNTSTVNNVIFKDNWSWLQ